MEEKTILLVTQNQHKVEEISAMLSRLATESTSAFRILSLKALSKVPLILEKGETFRENSFSKNASLLSWFFSQGIEELWKVFPLGRGYLLSDDSGLKWMLWVEHQVFTLPGTQLLNRGSRVIPQILLTMPSFFAIWKRYHLARETLASAVYWH